ncbi:MAG TPA: hypothetical protein VFM81_06265 [Actinomycetota bacterium]|nr:hypothetical protein [Actinomycetota bacterium]
MSDFDPAAIFEVLQRHGVDYVLIGGTAAILHGAANVTTDVDIVPEEGKRNLERLSAALTELRARIRVAGEEDGVPFNHDARSLSQVRIWNLVTDRGNLDISFQPSGTDGFSDLHRHVEKVRIDNVDVPVASLEDVIRSKEAADRVRDRAILPVLRALLEERQDR